MAADGARSRLWAERKGCGCLLWQVFPNGVRDSGRQGETLDDFVNHEHAQLSSLSRAHVVALRLYTRSART